MTRRSYKGNAAQTKLASGIGSTDLTFSVTTGGGAGYPDGTAGPFFIVLDAGLSGEEKVLCASRSADTFTVSTRGADDTTAAAHASGATVAHCLTKTDLDEANAHVNANSGVHGLTGGVVGTTDSQTLSNKVLTRPSIGDFTNAQHDHSTAAKGGNIPVTAVTGAAQDSAVVHLAGVETVTGAKTFTASSASTVPVTVKGAASQTSDLVDVQASDGSALWTVASDGSVTSAAKITAKTGVTVQNETTHTGNVAVSPTVTGVKIAFGSQNITMGGVSAAGTGIDLTSFGFTAAPKLFFSKLSSANVTIGTTGSVTSTTFTPRIDSADGSSISATITVDWLALGV